MNFDVIIGNPPYQLKDRGDVVGASPLYNKFIDEAKEIQPRYIVMIIPAKWYTTGRNLGKFRSEMLNDQHIRKIVDFTDPKEIFPDICVAGGICYFLWDRDYQGKCLFENHCNESITKIEKELNEYPVLVRYPIADKIIKKIRAFNEPTLDTIVRGSPFRIETNVRPMADGDLVLRYNKGFGKYQRGAVKSGKDIIDKWKVIWTRVTSENAGHLNKNGQCKVFARVEVLPPSYICTRTYMVGGVFDTEEAAKNFQLYAATKFVRFLVKQAAVTQQIGSKKAYLFIPIQDFTETWTDKRLYQKYGLANEEIEFIESMIKPPSKVL